ncbi:GspE/PulE family protein [Sulfurospirillum arcachonense]|uniref:GspE/PulE family protein n=1 Tax=Sulfurospirillum arcachonense TaxID=57666 RepID=UPI0004B957A3|nr:GspE/PulE family protein [Sulfurospirillum arcachonense]
MKIKNINTFENLNLYPDFIENINSELLVKNHLLLTCIEEKAYAILDENYLAEGLNYLAKLSLHVEVAFLDEDSYERLFHRYLEHKKDNDLNSSFSEDEKEDFLEDDLSLSEFLKTSSDILTNEESAPIIKFVNSLFYQAIKKNASDIHIETHDDRGIVRFRIDGVLVKHVDLDKHIINLIVNRIKVISNLDISEKRVPQDGRTIVKIAKKSLDIRVSVLPTYYGERVVMRMLMDSSKIPTLEELGFDEDLTQSFRALLSHSYGMILVTGPTGSGKSTTLHSFLKTIATPEKNIITVEDPVEYKTNDINQIQVNTKSGLTFSSGLRSILRQDPDVIMVGEIRDSETAKIAIQSALTGHLMLSTLHTNNTTAAITRLVDMGIEEFLISSSLLGVLAQRLVRKLCVHCKKEDGEFFTATGCSHCNFTGYAGRVAVGELFLIDDDVKSMLKEGMKDFEIREAMQKKGLVLLSSKIEVLVKDGTTSLQEGLRVGMRD